MLTVATLAVCLSCCSQCVYKDPYYVRNFFIGTRSIIMIIAVMINVVMIVYIGSQ